MIHSKFAENLIRVWAAVDWVMRKRFLLNKKNLRSYEIIGPRRIDDLA